MRPGRTSESFDMGSVSRSRSTSISSESQLPRTNLLVPPPVTPQPGFIASSAASQIITADQEFNTVDFVADEHDDEAGSSPSALVTPSALSLLNGFLDHILFNILAVSKSTQLSCIRPAVADVLKPRLAKEVVSAADDELSEYMGGEGDEQFEFRGGQQPTGDFDLVRSWKRTRLRCMVYTRLGDMEEDEEDEYISRDGLGESDSAPRRFASHVDNVTPAAAIFLTSIIEHLGEQALIISGETSRSRVSNRLNLERDEVTESSTERNQMNRLVVEDYDMEKLAMNATLGRLWRTWRKRIRSPNLSRTLSRESFRRRGIASTMASSRKSSVATIDELPARSVTSFDTAEAMEEELDPAMIPLPMSQHDVKEIQIPNFSVEPEGEVLTMEAIVAHKVRPRSLMVLPSPLIPRSPSSVASSPVVPFDSQRPKSRHARSRSLPDNSLFPLDTASAAVENTPRSASVDQGAAQISSPTPSEERKRLETMYEQDEAGDSTETQTGLAISTPTAGEVPNGFGPDSPASGKKTPTARHSMMAPSLSGASVEVEVSRPGSAQTAYRQGEGQRDGEVIEGQGMCEKPRPASAILRPRRKASGDPKKDDRSSPSVSTTSERGVPTQGAADSPRAQKKADDTSKADARKSTGGQTWFSNDDDDDDDAESSQVPGERAGTAASDRGAERAAVQRLPGQPSPTPSKSRRSESIDKRPGSSTSSKLKGLIGRSPHGEPATVRARNSSETERQSSGSRNSPRLEQLIQSEETIHYTLTPKNMRDMEEPDSHRVQANRSSTADLADFLKTTGPPGGEPPKDAPKSPSKGAVPKHQPIGGANAGVSSPKTKANMARDAKPAADSTRDFANIKSSGPPTPASGADNPKSPNTASSANRRTSDATDLSKKFIRPDSGTSSSTRGTTGPRLQARSAVAPKGEQTSDLIDFIREGPPMPGSHRIPRTVAPFRNTMDSDEMNNSVNRNSRASSPDESMATKSHTSFGSRTGLLDSANRSNAKAAPPAPKPAPSNKPNEFDDPMPARKQRRVPDPYAIDDDDDEELEEILGLQEKPPHREEESLVDFLRSVPPPPETDTTPQPFVTTNVTPTNNKASGGGLKARLLRGGEKTPASKPSKSSLRSSQTDSRPSGQSNYTTKVGMERNMNRPAQVHVTHGPASPKKETETSALADFLKYTGPPEPPRAPSALATNKPKDSGLSRFLMRRKKVEA